MVNLCKDINFNNFETHFEIVGIKVYYSNEFVTYPIVMNITGLGHHMTYKLPVDL